MFLFSDFREITGFVPTELIQYFQKKLFFGCLFHGSVKNDYLGSAGGSATLYGLFCFLVHASILALPVKKEPRLNALRGWRAG